MFIVLGYASDEGTRLPTKLPWPPLENEMLAQEKQRCECPSSLPLALLLVSIKFALSAEQA
jgi:hypothetical protein